MVYAIGFMMLFVIGGLTGIQLANPTISYQVHNTLFWSRISITCWCRACCSGC